MKYIQPKPFILFLSIFIILLALDQLSKQCLIQLMEEQGNINVLPFFNLVMVWNKGISFGMFSEGSEYVPYALIAMACLVSAFIMGMYFRKQNFYFAAATAFICSGAVGNIIDRIRFGAVADFFDFHINEYHWPAFNVADSCIFIGVALVLLESIFEKRGQAKNE